MSEQVDDEVKPLSLFGVLIVLFCFVPWGWGMILGLVVSPFIAGFKVGRAIAGEIADEQLGEAPKDDKRRAP